MKKHYMAVILILFAAAVAEAGLWSPPLQNASFENEKLGAGAWTQYVDLWFKGDWWGSFVERERSASDIPLTPYGDNWGGVQDAGYIYQQVGTWDGSGLYDITVLYGQRFEDDFASIDISFYAGGYAAGAADDVGLEDIGAMELSTVTVTPASFVGNENPLLEEMTSQVLTDGPGPALGTALWLKVANNGGKSYFDNVRLVVSKRAWQPVPANGATRVPPAQVLSWNTAILENGSVNPGVVSHKVYMSDLSTDPNVLPNPTLTLKATVAASGSTASYDPPGDLLRDGRYYWRIDEVYSDSSVSTGLVWHFDMLLSRPMITEGTPADAVVPVGSTASFTVEATNPYTLDATGMSYAWYKVQSGGDVPVGTNSKILTISSAGESNEGFYYCIVTLLSNGKTSTSRQAELVTKRLIGHWKMDGNALDSSANANNGILMNEPVGHTTWVTGVDGLALNIGETGMPYIEVPAATSGDYNLTRRLSVSIWMKTLPSPNYYAMLIGKAESDLNNSWILSQDGHPWLLWKVQKDDIYDWWWETQVTLNQEWHHVVATWDIRTGEKKIYVDGILAGTRRGCTEQCKPTNTPVRIGYYFGDYIWSETLLDDARIYNYMMDAAEVAELYADTLGISLCFGYPDKDFDEDCMVTLSDMAAFVAGWMECNLYPVSECQ